MHCRALALFICAVPECDTTLITAASLTAANAALNGYDDGGTPTPAAATPVSDMVLVNERAVVDCAAGFSLNEDDSTQNVQYLVCTDSTPVPGTPDWSALEPCVVGACFLFIHTQLTQQNTLTVIQ